MRRRLLSILTGHLQTPFVALVLGAMVVMYWLSRSFSDGARLFTTVVAGAGIFLAGLELVRQWRTRGAKEEQDFSDLGDEKEDSSHHARALLYFGWLAGYLGLFLLVGVMPAAGLYVLTFLRLQYRAPWRISLATAAGMVLLLWVLGRVLHLRWPDPLLFG